MSRVCPPMTPIEGETPVTDAVSMGIGRFVGSEVGRNELGAVTLKTGGAFSTQAVKSESAAKNTPQRMNWNFSFPVTTNEETYRIVGSPKKPLKFLYFTTIVYY
jgi:hypothetical protein